MRAPLWLDIKGGKDTATLTVSLARCRDCGQVKATSNPCSFDHLAALMQFGDYLATEGDTP